MIWIAVIALGLVLLLVVEYVFIRRGVRRITEEALAPRNKYRCGCDDAGESPCQEHGFGLMACEQCGFESHRPLLPLGFMLVMCPCCGQFYVGNDSDETWAVVDMRVAMDSLVIKRKD